jgi:hypothetical protein
MNALIPAKPPFMSRGHIVTDADGNWVVTCNQGFPACGFFKDKSAIGCCPKCGRLWIRMEWATPEQCGIEVKP